MAAPSDQSIRFSLEITPGNRLLLVRHPVSVEPADRTMAIVEGDGWRGQGVFRSGAWQWLRGGAFSRPVLYWTVLDRRSAHG